jgi:multicomponent Na+:H+ antiporter subunit E
MLVTLTPGTLSIDVSADKRVLYIHFLDIEDVEEARRNIKNGLERQLLEVLR